MPNWVEVQNEIGGEIQKNQLQAAHHQLLAMQALDTVRRRYLKKLNEYNGRNVIAYYSAFLSKTDILSDINDEDKNGFMMAVHKLPKVKGLDLILHTPGGSIASTQSIVSYLQDIFDRDIRAIIPQMAMSAGTMVACSCKEILMGKQSNLGPIDPHLRGAPAYGIIAEFKRAYKEIKADPSRFHVWQPIISQYRPAFLSQCENAIQWSNRFVANQLSTVMFAGKTPREKRQAKQKAAKIVKALTDYTGNRSHSRHIHLDECKAMGLKVISLEDDNTHQDLVLTVHHCFMHSLMNSAAFKIIENHNGVAFVKQAMDPNRAAIRQTSASPLPA